jgi:hypothetical protein
MIAELFARRSTVSRNRLAVLGLMAALGLLILPGAVLPDGCDDCDDIEGNFSSQVVPCPPPAVLCTHGQLTGDLVATYDFTMLTLVPDPSDPTAELYTGTSVITTKDGSQLFSQDTGIIHPKPPGSLSPFVTTAHLIGGTGMFQNVCGGKIVASGKLDFATGKAVGTYTGQICQ